MKARRFLAWVVAAVMLLTSFALPASLGGVREAEAASLDEISKPALTVKEKAAPKGDPDEYPTSGQCGNNLFWQFYSYSGELVITGSGEMWSWYNYYSWKDYEYADQVLSVTLPKGLTNIGQLAFAGCTALQEITLPSTVKRIDYQAFQECTGLRSITLPKGLTNIYSYAFDGCSALTHVYYEGKNHHILRQ